jgi:hypothetical protein
MESMHKSLSLKVVFDDERDSLAAWDAMGD